MYADEIAKIKDSIVAARAKLLATTDDLDKGAWEWRPGDGRWSIQMTLAHVGRAQWGHVEVARRLVAGRLLELSNFDLDAWNTAEVAKRADW
jgi:hypothetical protein